MVLRTSRTVRGEVVTLELATLQTSLRYGADAGSTGLCSIPQVPHLVAAFVANYCVEKDKGLRAAGHSFEALPAPCQASGREVWGCSRQGLPWKRRELLQRGQGDNRCFLEPVPSCSCLTKPAWEMLPRTRVCQPPCMRCGGDAVGVDVSSPPPEAEHDPTAAPLCQDQAETDLPPFHP